ncbi:MAG TPA: LamG-like jellyroll fold domain-containing protein [Pyrinomonadaceae bacterium]|nr:LamG-like jellyroll fold domain-containing protein [Pyrinomonadaceae bacterium]
MPALSDYAPAKLKASLARAAFTALLALAALIATAPGALAQHNTPTINGTISAGEYGDHAEGMNQKATGSGQTWYMTWDNTNLYVAVTNANLGQGVVLYIDLEPQTAPRTWDNNTKGNLTGVAYDGANFSPLPFLADFVAYFKDGYQECRRKDNAGGWTSATAPCGTYLSGAGDVRELAIPWSAIRGNTSVRPLEFNFFGYAVSHDGFVYGQIPQGNPVGNVGTSATADRFYRVRNTGNGTSTEPFSSEYGNCVAPPSDLEAWWTGNGYRDDIQGSNHLTLQNGLTFASGKVRSAFSLDGADDYAEAADSDSLSVTGSLTVDAWISLSAYPTAGTEAPIVSKGNTLGGATEGSYSLSVDNLGFLRMCIWSGDVSKCVTASNQIPLNTFTHVAGVFNSLTQQLHAYHGNNTGTSSTGVSAIDDSGEPLLIGAGDVGISGATSRQFFAGFIDEVEVFSRALSFSEFNDITRADNVGKCAADLVVSSPFPEGPAFVGDQVETTITIVNQGNATAQDVILTDTLPAGFEVVNVSPSGGVICSTAANVVTCELGDMLPNVSFLNVSITAEATAQGVLTNSAHAESPSPDLKPGNDKLSEAITIVGVKSVTLTTPSATGGCSGTGATVAGTVTFNRPAPRDGTLTLGSSNNGAASPTDTSVSFLAGATTVPFTVSLGTVTSSTQVAITATLDTGAPGGSTTLTVKPIQILSFVLASNSVTGGNSVNGTVTLTCAPAAGTTVGLSTNRPSVTAITPSPFAVGPDTSSGSFTINTNPVASPTTATITATLNGKSFTQKLTINP